MNRVRSVLPHALLVSGVCSRMKDSRCSEPAAWRQTACLVSAQSIPTQAAHAAGEPGVMWHLIEEARVASRDRRADVLRRHERELVTRQTLSMR